MAELDRRGLLTGIITQNVDGLHQAAGARSVIELHGSLDRVRLPGLRRAHARAPDAGPAAAAANPAWAGGRPIPINPDGDVVLADDQVAGFRVVDCTGCGGLLMPDVVFFGENVPRAAGRTVLRRWSTGRPPWWCSAPR